MPLLGGFSVTRIEWIDAQSILLRFTSTYTRHRYQLYRGKVLIGSQPNPAARTIVGQMSPSHYPEVLSLVAVDDTEYGIDHGDKLGVRPWNKPRAVFNAAGLAADARYLDVYAAAEVGGAVDTETRVARINHAGQASHTWTGEPLGPSGAWPHLVKSVDDKPESGNQSSGQSFSLDIVTHPPDLTPDADGARFTLALTNGALTVTCTLPPDYA